MCSSVPCRTGDKDSSFTLLGLRGTQAELESNWGANQKYHADWDLSVTGNLHMQEVLANELRHGHKQMEEVSLLV